MKLLGVRSIWCICVFWTVYVRSSVYQTSYKCSKQDMNSEEKTKTLLSVLDNNLVSCAVTCHTDFHCLYFVYNRHNKRCDRYYEDDTREVCDNGRTNGTANHMTYKLTCKKKCQKKTATYKLSVKTGRKRYSASDADLWLNIKGSCGSVAMEMKNGKDITLGKGLRSTFKFINDYIFEVKEIGLAFVDPCHNDGWFVEMVDLDVEGMVTGDRHTMSFEPSYWLSSHEDEPTTGIRCSCVPSSDTDEESSTKCSSAQICE